MIKFLALEKIAVVINSKLISSFLQSFVHSFICSFRASVISWLTSLVMGVGVQLMSTVSRSRLVNKRQNRHRTQFVSCVASALARTWHV